MFKKFLTVTLCALPTTVSEVGLQCYCYDSTGYRIGIKFEHLAETSRNLRYTVLRSGDSRKRSLISIENESKHAPIINLDQKHVIKCRIQISLATVYLYFT